MLSINLLICGATSRARKTVHTRAPACCDSLETTTQKHDASTNKTWPLRDLLHKLHLPRDHTPISDLRASHADPTPKLARLPEPHAFRNVWQIRVPRLARQRDCSCSTTRHLTPPCPNYGVHVQASTRSLIARQFDGRLTTTILW